MIRQQLLRAAALFTRTNHSPPSLGRWNINDNADIKSALANIDCCGDKLCGDPSSSKIAIDEYTKTDSYIKEISPSDIARDSHNKAVVVHIQNSLATRSKNVYLKYYDKDVGPSK